MCSLNTKLFYRIGSIKCTPLLIVKLHRSIFMKHLGAKNGCRIKWDQEKFLGKKLLRPRTRTMKWGERVEWEMVNRC